MQIETLCMQSANESPLGGDRATRVCQWRAVTDAQVPGTTPKHYHDRLRMGPARTGPTCVVQVRCLPRRARTSLRTSRSLLPKKYGG